MHSLYQIVAFLLMIILVGGHPNEEGGKISDPRKLSHRPLNDALIKHDKPAIEAFLREHGNGENLSYDNVLLYATYTNLIPAESVQILLELGANPRVQLDPTHHDSRAYDFSGNTPLEIAKNRKNTVRSKIGVLEAWLDSHPTN